MENSPSALLQSELSSLTAEKIDLQRKLDQSTNSSKAARQKLLKAYQVCLHTLNNIDRFIYFVLYSSS